ncbi:MAG: hypothetical protein ACKOTZ_01940 [Chloroflexota bacterium]
MRTAADPGPDPARAASTARGRLRSPAPWPWRPFPAHALLLPAWAVLFLVAENSAQLPVAEALGPVVEGVLAASALLFLGGIVLRDLRRGGLVAVALLAAWYLHGHVAALVAPAGLTGPAALVAWLPVVALAAVGALRLGEQRVAGVTRALSAALVVLVVLAGVRIVPVEVARGAAAGEAAADAVGGSGPAARTGPARDIWIIVLDRYGSAAALTALGGFTSDLPDWLATRGFAVAPEARASYGRTTLSLAARMDPASRDPAPVQALLSDHAVGRFLRAQGYRYVHLGSWFEPTKRSAIADENPVLRSGSDLRALVESTTAAPALATLLGLRRPPAHHLLPRAAALFSLRELARIRATPGPKLVVAHVLLPHEPYVFDETGRYPTPEERAARTLDDGYRRQMLWTNAQVRALVDDLLDVPADAQPAILLLADEGPYPDRYAASQATFDWTSATPDELATKFGVLTALYAPGPTRPAALPLEPAVTTVNLASVLLSRYWDGPWRLLPDRSWASAGWYRPYDLIDVTDRIP